jgi:hypothetical protein
MAEVLESRTPSVMETSFGSFPSAFYKTFFNTTKTVSFGFDPSKSKENNAFHVGSSVRRPVWELGYDRANTKEIKLVPLTGSEARFYLKGQSEAIPLVPELENLMLELARLAGLYTADAVLVNAPGNQIALLVKKADAPYKNKPSVPVFPVLPDASAAVTWEQLAIAVKKSTTHSGLDLLGVLERALFSYLIGAYNVSPRKFFIQTTPEGIRQLGPVSGYLPMLAMFSKQIDPQDFSFALNGKTRKLTVQDFLHFGSTVGLYGKQIDNAVKRFAEVIPAWERHIMASSLPASVKADLAAMIEQRAGRLMIRRRF